MKVFKLKGEAYEITEEPFVYKSVEDAKAGIQAWVHFLGMSVEEALKTKEVTIEEWDLI